MSEIRRRHRLTTCKRLSRVDADIETTTSTRVSNLPATVIINPKYKRHSRITSYAGSILLFHYSILLLRVMRAISQAFSKHVVDLRTHIHGILLKPGILIERIISLVECLLQDAESILQEVAKTHITLVSRCSSPRMRLRFLRKFFFDSKG